MLRKICLFVFALILVSGVFAASPDESTWLSSAESGEVLRKTFSFTANLGEDDTESLEISTSGDLSSWITISPTTLTIAPSETKSFESIVFIPTNVTSGTYSGNIAYTGTSNGTISIQLLVQEKYRGGCIIQPLTTRYITSLKQGSTSAKPMSVLVSGNCEEPVNIRDIDVTGGGTISTDTGKKPVRIADAALGSVNPGQEVTFTAFFDSVGMGPGTYTPTATITAIHKGVVITTSIAFEITITGITTPVGPDNFLTLPEYDIPNNVKSGEDFQIRVTKLDPNFQMRLLPNDRLYGKLVERTEDTWIYKGYINGTGPVLVELYPEYNGAQVGSIIKRTITVSSGAGGPVLASGQLKFEFYPANGIEIGGSTVNILVKDNVTNNIIEGSSIYLNGMLMEEQRLVVDTDQQYCLSATASDYATLDFCFTPKKNQLSMYVTPEKPMVGDYITITIRDSNNADVNATIYVNEEEIEGDTFSVGFEGNYTVRAELTGYESSSISFPVAEPIGLLEAPESISKGDKVRLVITKNVSYRVTHSAEAGLEETELVSGQGTEILFDVKEPGFYYIYAKGDNIRRYRVEGKAGIKFPSLKIPVMSRWAWGIILVVLVGAAAILIRSKRGSGRSVGYGSSSSSEDEVVEEAFGL